MKTVEQILAEIERLIKAIDGKYPYSPLAQYELLKLKQFILSNNSEPTEKELMLRDLPSEIEYLKDQIDLRVKLLYKIQNSEPHKCEHDWDYSTELTSCRKCGLHV